jgi:hypothetical protein
VAVVIQGCYGSGKTLRRIRTASRRADCRAQVVADEIVVVHRTVATADPDVGAESNSPIPADVSCA